MRKLVVWFIAAVLATYGLVHVTGAPASAIVCPYTGCVRTITDIDAPSRVVKGSIVPIRVTVLALAGTANPRGTLDASCSRRNKTKSKSVPYQGETRYVFFKLRKRGLWTCEVKFSSPRKFRKSSDTATVRVVRRR